MDSVPNLLLGKPLCDKGYSSFLSSSTAYSKTLKGIPFFQACLHTSLFIRASKEAAEVQTQLFSMSLAAALNHHGQAGAH